MSLIYLLKNRERPPLLTKRWLKVWAKRAVNMFGLFAITFRRIRYSIKGVKVGQLTIFCELEFNGSACRLTVGERCFIGTNVHLALHDKIFIGNNVSINSNVQLLTGSHDTYDSAWQLIKKPIVIKDFAWIAYNAIILPGVTIGTGAVIGAGAVVSKDVPDYAVVAGNPAKVVGQRCQKLAYSPVDFCAPFEAWLGNPAKLSKSQT